MWIAIADVPSRDCQALSVVALEARSIHTHTQTPKKQKNKKTRNQKNKKTKKQKQKKKIAHPKGRGQMQSVGSCLFVFFGFLVCVWIAIADVPSRDCQALSVGALEARSIHYSTAMFAMT